MNTTHTRHQDGEMGFHGGSVTGATAEKLSEKPRFHKRYSKGLMTMETAPKMGTRKHEDKLMNKTNGCLNEDYVTYKEAEIRALTRGLAEATRVKNKIDRIRDGAQSVRRRLRSSNLVMVDGTYLESAYEVIKEPETTRDLYHLTQANETKKAGLGGVTIYGKKDNLMLKTLIPRITKEKESCVICLEDHTYDLMFSVDRCGHSFCVICVKQHITSKLLDGTLPNCPHHGCTTQLSVDRCGKLLTPKMSMKWKEKIKENSIPHNERVYCPYKKCSYLMSRTQLVSVSPCGQRNCFKCGCSFCLHCKAPWHSMGSCTEYKKLLSDTLNEKLMTLANLSGWRQCGKCNHMVERSGGCSHMLCRCGFFFCYNCGAGMNSSLVHRCRTSEDDLVAQPRFRLESDATYVPPLSLYVFITILCLVMYDVFWLKHNLIY